MRKTLRYINFGFTTRSEDEKLKTYNTFFSGQIKRKAEINKWVISGSFDGYLVPQDDSNSLEEILNMKLFLTKSIILQIIY